MLYPIMTKTRNLIDLSGVWKFSFDDKDLDVSKKLKDFTLIAVPGSFNEQFNDNELRLKVGKMVYQKEFFIPENIKDERIVLRFGSATHKAEVYLNGQLIKEHKGGFTPFEVEINEFLRDDENLLTVLVDNTLDYSSLPVGNLKTIDKNGKKVKKVVENFDFFNYAGLQRPVKIYTRPQAYIKDITIIPKINVSELKADVRLLVDYVAKDDVIIKTTLLDEEDRVVGISNGEDSSIQMEDINLWKPMDAYLYRARVEILQNDKTIDVYEEPFGLRTVEVKNGKFYINNKEFYFKGFGKHEDNFIHGRGFDELLNIKDINLMKWINANSFRTSHYPYSEEMMRLADREGIVVIDEVPAVGLYNNFAASLTGQKEDNLTTWEKYDTKEAHELVIKELIERDKNHACVVMWSIANEPASHEKGADKYFEPLFKLARELDPQKRPVAFVNIMTALPDLCLVSKYTDVLCLNRYYGWYVDHGDIEEGMKKLEQELNRWTELYPDKPIMFAEYGGDTMTGFHSLYDIPYTEEYQKKLLEKTHEILDKTENFVGEHIWNFADFETGAGLIRIKGNNKGVFTRNREPKMVAFSVKKRWENLG